MYRVHWKGFGSEYDTWEPEGQLAGCHELLEEFHQKQKKARAVLFIKFCLHNNSGKTSFCSFHIVIMQLVETLTHDILYPPSP